MYVMFLGFMYKILLGAWIGYFLDRTSLQK